MKRYIQIAAIVILSSCAPNGTEEDAKNYETEKAKKPVTSAKSADFYIDRAYQFGALDQDSIGDCPKAIKYIDSAISVEPYNMAAYRLKTYATTLMGDYLGALSIIEQAIKLTPKDDENYVSRAGILMSIDKREKALLDYYMAVELNPKNGRAHEAIGYIEIDKGNKTIGCEHLTIARDLGHFLEHRWTDKYLCQ